MKQFYVVDYLSTDFIKVLDTAYPKSNMTETVFAIFSKSIKTGVFLGLATSQEVALHPDWPFKDFIAKKPLRVIKDSISLRQALAVMKKESVTTLPVMNESNQFVGVLTELRVLEVLYQREHRLLRQIFENQKRLEDENINKTVMISNIEEQVRHLQILDRLTGLPSLREFRTQLDQWLTLKKTHDRQGVLILIGVDGFRDINARIGSKFGDYLLQLLAERLENLLDKSVLLARKGGDEFVVLFFGSLSKEAVISHADQILQGLNQPFPIDNHEVVITVSLGICFIDDDIEDSDFFLANADIALKAAKLEGRNKYKIFDRVMGEKTKLLQKRKDYLSDAMKNKELFIVYQPQVDTSSQEIIALEALLRWQNSDLGLVMPTDFISLAEETGLITLIGEWVLKTACVQAYQWQKIHKPFRISVNLSARQFQGMNASGVDKLVEMVEGALKESQLDPSLLEIEITESVILKNYDLVVLTLKKLKTLGVRISCDDFGTGYSSLSYLKLLPFDTIKIDKSFIDDVENDPSAVAIIRAIIFLANQLKIDVIAEGVETKSQLLILRGLGCHFIQGYYYSQPLAVEKAALLLEEGICLN